MKFKSEHLKILKKIEENPVQNQRILAKNLNISLGKINYCLRELKTKGLVKVKNFKNSENKFKYMYYLTPKGFTEKARITINFLKKINAEFEMLKSDSKQSKK